ncbi:MAG: thioredoxin domain-containing protein [Frankiaceae bacterium]|nr:thioredoxin domain-containing protein [Frankiaceae bacterium]MBV9368441.1 thioredoxin domain-containing protein [Frankiales bacterium]
MANRLADATSPYLLQHKDNPVDWWPWCDEAFTAARQRGVPVLLSVGYAACHWCHVMAHESFEDEAAAAYVNKHFVAIKVDREERPDVDAVYMEATQAMTGHGGWPMTCFLTPNGEPFFCGTYFPPTDRPGMPSFRTVCQSVVKAWTERRDEIEAAGADVVRQLAEQATSPLADAPLTAAHLDAAAGRLLTEYDDRRGGFGGAPKFPPSMALEFLLRHYARTGDKQALDAVATTCERMARGGIYDQLAGGFARYSTDDSWVVPHFEKMLYDNALLARVYAHWWRTTGAPLAQRIAVETCEWMLAELRTTEGGFASSLDADSEGEEGKFYVWSPEEVGPVAARMFHVTDEGTFEHGRSVLQLLDDPPDEEQWRDERARLRHAREQRVRPARDDKVVAAWNGLAIAALAETGTLFDRPDFVDAATKAARLLVDVHLDGGQRIRRVSRDGVAGAPQGVLEDYGDVAEGFLTLHQVTGDKAWLDHATALLDQALEHFHDSNGGFFDTADDAEKLVRRPQDPTDNATPSGLAAVAHALVTSTALTADQRHRAAAERAIATVVPLLQRFPRYAGWAAAAGEAMVAGPLEVAVVDHPELARIARRTTSPGAVVVTQGDSPLLDGRPDKAAYVCQNFACDAPITDPDQLRKRLDVTT